MTTPPRASWDDARLDAAFAARAAAVPPVPADLAASVVERLARRPRAASSQPRALLAAAAAIVAVVGLAGLASITLTHRPSVGASVSPLPLGSGVVADVAEELGLPRIGVADAMAIHNATRDDREMLVSGYLSNDPGPYQDTGLVVGADCDLAATAAGHLLGPACAPMLMADPESIVTRTLTTVTVHVPSGPAFHPAFGLTFLPSTKEVPIGGAAVPSPITLVGHFNDRRAASCPIGAEIACQTTFLVDRLVEVDGRGVYAPASLVPAREAAEQAMNRAAPGLTILTTVATTGSDLARLEPSLADPSAVPPELAAAEMWLIQALPTRDGTGAPRSVRTFLVADGIGIVVEMTADGPVVRPDPGPSPSPTPAVDTTVVMDLVAHPMSVSAAIDRRDLHRDHAELAVEGYASAPAGSMFCSLIRPDLPALDQCPNSFTWLAEQASPSRADGALEPPAGPAFNMLVQPETILQVHPGSTPVHVVALGHFDDHRAASCTGDQVERCERNFIVDAILEPADPGYPPVIVKVDKTATPRATVAEAIASAGLAADDPRVLAAFAIPTQSLAAFEPAAAGAAALNGVDVVWIVRWVDRTDVHQPILRSRLVADLGPGDPATTPYELTESGLVPVGLPG